MPTDRTVVPLTPADLWIRGDALPRLLDGWCGPISDREYGHGVRCRDEIEIDNVRGWYWFPNVGARGLPNCDIRMDCRRPEVQARLADVLHHLGVYLSNTLAARRHGGLSNIEAAALCWLAVERHAAGLPVSHGVFRTPQTKLRETLFARGDILRDPGALLLPLPDGRIGRLEAPRA